MTMLSMLPVERLSSSTIAIAAIEQSFRKMRTDEAAPPVIRYAMGLLTVPLNVVAIAGSRAG